MHVVANDQRTSGRSDQLHRAHRFRHRLEGDRSARFGTASPAQGDERRNGRKWERCWRSSSRERSCSPSSPRSACRCPPSAKATSEIWIAELGLAGELWKARDGKPPARSIAASPCIPSLGDRVRIAFKKLSSALAFCGDMKSPPCASVRIRQDSTRSRP